MRGWERGSDMESERGSDMESDMESDTESDMESDMRGRVMREELIIGVINTYPDPKFYIAYT